MRVQKNNIHSKFCLLQLLLFFIAVLGVKQTSFAQNNIRLAKERYKGNDFTSTTEYSYDANGRIIKIVLLQDGKLHCTTNDFVFNSDGLLTSFVETYYKNNKIPALVYTLTYDAKKRLSTYEAKNKKNNAIYKSRAYSYKGDTVKVVEPIHLSQIIFYVFDGDSNIVKIESNHNPSTAFTNLYNKHDYSKNPHLLVGGYVYEKPISIHNSLEDNYVDIYVINRKIEYEKIFASQYKSGGAKIPTQFKNGLPLKVTETSFDKAYNKVMPVSTTTYQYIKL